MIIAGLQLDIAWEDPAENQRRAQALALRAAPAGARLLVLPEMFATGFTMNGARASAAADSTRQFLAGLAREHSAWVLGGFAEPGPDRPRNAAALLDPEGREQLLYHKIHPFTLAGEHEHYAGGAALPSADVGGLRVTPVICYDLRFPELFRVAAPRTDLFAVIANWPAKRRSHWSTLLRARAIENQCYVLGLNRVGEGDGLQYSGDSCLLDPLGETVAAVACESTALLGEVRAEVVERVRREFSFLADRRPEIYRGL